MTLRTHKLTVLVSLVATLAACGGGGKPTGPPAPITDTVRTIEGVFSYFATGPTFNAPDANGRYIPILGFRPTQFPVPAKFIPIEIVAPDGTVMGADRTNVQTAASRSTSISARSLRRRWSCARRRASTCRSARRHGCGRALARHRTHTKQH